jgi:peptide/nickel transport system substrate-binding protein
MNKRGLSRRQFLKIGALSTAAGVVQVSGVSALTGANSVIGASPDTVARQSQYNEAPMLRELVDAGMLPPVDERLPGTPEVVEVLEEIGEYGGISRVAIVNPNQLFGDPQAIMGTELILRIGPDFSTIVPGLAESWEFNADATEQTLYLREGLKWSDGAPFTSEDFRFYWEDVANNEELSPAGPATDWRVGTDRTPMDMEIVDELTVKLSFVEPYVLVILPEAFYAGSQGGIWGPAHYGKQFHADYADETELNTMVADASFETWIELFQDRMRVGSTIPAQIDLPGMTAYIRVDDNPERHIYERNPYYFKVDAEGNQLPYIDRCEIEIAGNQELINAKLVAGEMSMLGRQSELASLPLYQQSSEAANIRILLWNSTTPCKMLFYPNQTALRPELREFFQNVDVRRALSIGIDRAEMNEVIHFGLGEPRQWSMWPSSKYFREGDDQVWSQFDPDMANQMLDDAGYGDRDGDGFRLFPNGERLSWVIQFDAELPDAQETIELAAEYWGELGLEVIQRPQERTLLEELVAANEIEMTVWDGDISDITWPNFPRLMLPGITNAKWGRAWELWLLGETDNPVAEEPPEEVKQQWANWRAALAAATVEEHVEKARVQWEWFQEYLPGWGTVGVPKPVVLKQNLRNFPEEGIWGFSVIRAVPVHPETFFFKSS